MIAHKLNSVSGILIHPSGVLMGTWKYLRFFCLSVQEYEVCLFVNSDIFGIRLIPVLLKLLSFHKHIINLIITLGNQERDILLNIKKEYMMHFKSRKKVF